MRLTIWNRSQGWLWIAASIAALATMATAGVLYATSRPAPAHLEQSAPVGVELVSSHPLDTQEQIDLPPLPTKEPPQYPNLDSNLNQLAEDANDPGFTNDAPVLVTFYVATDHVAALRAHLEDNGVYVRNVGEDYIEAHVPPTLLGPASQQSGVLRVDTVIPPWTN